MTKKNRAVYRIWHNKSITGRVGYVGKDSHSPRRLNLRTRVNEKDSVKLYAAFQLYPIWLWQVEILAKGFKSDKALNEAEKYWIKKFDSKNKGYNCTDGGDGGTGRVVSEETRAKLRKYHGGMKGRKHRPETLLLMSIARKGQKRSLETRKRMSLAQRNRTPEHQAKITAGIKASWLKRKKDLGETGWRGSNTNAA